MTDPTIESARADSERSVRAARLRELLRWFRYPSSVDGRERGLMEHHIDALADYLADRVFLVP